MATTVGPSGQYNALCDVCGFKKKNWQLKKRWDGLWVCAEDWEPRHPADFYRTRNDFHKLPFTRPDNDGITISVSPPGGALNTAPIVDQGEADYAVLT